MHQNTELAKFIVVLGVHTTLLNNKEETAASLLENQENGMTSEIFSLLLLFYYYPYLLGAFFITWSKAPSVYSRCDKHITVYLTSYS
jgi:hypothetical protein